MPDSRLGERLTQRHLSVQRRLSEDTVRRLSELWILLTIEGTLTEDDWISAVTVLLNERHGVSSAMARSYYQARRRAETGLFEDVRQFGRPNFNTGRVEGHARTYLTYRDGLIAAGLTAEQAGRQAGRKMAMDLVEEALDGGRYTVIDTARMDDRAVGWYRVSDGDPCAFCALLLGRGIVYKSQSSASFESHPKCNCSAKSAYRNEKFGDEQSKAYGDLYRRATRGHRDKLNAFRRAYERPHLHLAAP